MKKCNRWENAKQLCSGWGSNPGRWVRNQTLYHMAINAGLYSKAVQALIYLALLHIHSPFLDSSSNLSLSFNNLYIRHRCALSPSDGLFALRAKCSRWENAKYLCRCWGSNPGRLVQNQILYHIAIKAGLLCKAVQVSKAVRVLIQALLQKYHKITILGCKAIL